MAKALLVIFCAFLTVTYSMYECRQNKGDETRECVDCSRVGGQKLGRKGCGHYYRERKTEKGGDKAPCPGTKSSVKGQGPVCYPVRGWVGGGTGFSTCNHECAEPGEAPLLDLTTLFTGVTGGNIGWDRLKTNWVTKLQNCCYIHPINPQPQPQMGRDERGNPKMIWQEISDTWQPDFPFDCPQVNGRVTQKPKNMLGMAKASHWRQDTKSAGIWKVDAFRVCWKLSVDAARTEFERVKAAWLALNADPFAPPPPIVPVQNNGDGQDNGDGNNNGAHLDYESELEELDDLEYALDDEIEELDAEIEALEMELEIAEMRG